MRPGWQLGAFGLLEAAALNVFFWARLNREHGALLCALINPAVRERYGAFRRTFFGIVATVPEDVARLEVETEHEASY